MTEQLEIERRFLVESIPCIAAWPIPFKISQIRQTYLTPVIPGTVERVRERKWRESGNTTYVHNIKEAHGFGVVLEKEQPLSEKTYRAFLERADPERDTLWKCRMTFEYAGWTWELDEIFTRPMIILEVELPTIDTEVDLPPWLNIEREVTGESEYSNHSLSKKLA